jgi:hypothetical protein
MLWRHSGAPCAGSDTGRMYCNQAGRFDFAAMSAGDNLSLSLHESAPPCGSSHRHHRRRTFIIRALHAALSLRASRRSNKLLIRS